MSLPRVAVRKLSFPPGNEQLTEPIDPVEWYNPLRRKMSICADITSWTPTLTRGINDFHKTHPIIYNQLFSVSVLYRGVVGLQKNGQITRL